MAELLFAGRLFPPVSKLGYRLRKYGYFGYYNVNENGSRKVLCTADGMNEDKAVAPASFSGPVTMAWEGGSMVEEKCLGIGACTRSVSGGNTSTALFVFTLPWIPK
ncbi:MAG: hypothetical protein ACLSV6_04555 [Butyricicoccus sp.]